jgi:hypothetical protein
MVDDGSEVGPIGPGKSAKLAGDAVATARHASLQLSTATLPGFERSDTRKVR